MKFQSAIFYLLAICCVLLCSCEFETATSIISEPSEFNFGFAAEWQMPSDELSKDESKIRIARNAETKGLYDVYDTSADKKPWIRFKTCRLGSTDTALVEIDTGIGPRFGGDGRFYYAFANVEKDSLTIEQIDGDKLIALLKTTKTNCVIDRGILFTEITAESDALRKLLTGNREKLISKDRIILNRSVIKK